MVAPPFIIDFIFASLFALKAPSPTASTSSSISISGLTSDAIEKAYSIVPNIKFENAYYRHDIGKRALMAKEEF